MRFVAFPATEYDEVLLGYQPGQMVEQWENQCFKDHLCPCPQGTSLTMVGKNILTKYIYLARTVYTTGRWAGLMATLHGSRLCVNNNLVTGFQAQLSVKPLSLLMLFWLSLIWMASLTRWSMYPDALSNIEMLLKLIWCPALMLCSATADFHGWSSHVSCAPCIWPLWTSQSGWYILFHTHREYDTHQGFSGQVYIFGQNVFPNHCQTSTLRMRTEMVFETLVFSPFNHLTRLTARENFIIIHLDVLLC
jgi:hypothetical protein